MLRRDELPRALDRLAARNPRHDLELYGRRSERRRVRFERGRPSSIANLDELGVAVRAVDARLREGFAAVTGLDSRSLDGATVAAIAAIREPPARGLVRVEGTPRSDGDPACRVPDPQELNLWLEAVKTRVESAGPRPGAVLVTRAQIEAGRIDEELVSTCGLQARRVRERAWASLHVTAGNERSRREFSWSLASSGRGRLPDASLLVGAVAAVPCSDRTLRPGHGEAVVFAPLAAALLVRGVTSRLTAGSGLPNAREAGPGWRLVDRPQAPEALAGGEFDDTGAPTATTCLADGRSCAAGFPVHGTQWRASFRDPPAVRAAFVEVEEDPSACDPGGIRVEDLRLHSLGGVWLLEALASRASGECGRLTMRVRPEAVPERCMAAWGPAHVSAQSVRTPALVFDSRGWFAEP